MCTDVQVGRYVRYYEYLRGSAVQYERILFTDVTDVMFQGDPFDGLPDGELLCFLEDHRATIGRCESNSFWVRQIFGEEALRRLSNCRISCSGTTVRISFTAIESYVEQLLKYAPPKLMLRLRGHRGHDQGIHNFLIHTGALPHARLVENGEHVLTLAHTPPADIKVSSDSILTADGRRAPIVHQYTRHRFLREWITLSDHNLHPQLEVRFSEPPRVRRRLRCTCLLLRVKRTS